MELRKIQKTRGGTFFVTVPKEWAIKNGIKRGSVISTSITSDGHLVIDPQYNLEPTPQTIVVKPTPHLSREIIGKYLLGYDIVRIEAKERITMEQREIIKETSSRLIGLEIIEEDYAKVVMQCLLEPSALPPERVLRREHLITSGMYGDALTALVESDVQLAKSVISRDNEADRLYFLLVRILRTIIQNPSLNEKLAVSPIDCLDYRLTASLVESVGDLSSQIAEYVVRLNGKKLDMEALEPLTKLYKIVHESYKDAIAAFLSRSISIAASVRDRKADVTEMHHKIESVCNALPMDIAQNIISVTSLVSQIYDYSVDISDLTTPKIS
jgi:phosphate uptake regulator